MFYITMLTLTKIYNKVIRERNEERQRVKEKEREIIRLKEIIESQKEIDIKSTIDLTIIIVVSCSILYVATDILDKCLLH